MNQFSPISGLQIYNPAFVRRVLEKRRREAAAARNRKIVETNKKKLEHLAATGKTTAANLCMEKPDNPEPEKWTLEEVAYYVCWFHGIPIFELCGPSMTKEITKIKWQFFYWATVLTGLSAVKIGNFCAKDHSTVIRGRNIYAERKGWEKP